MGIARLQRFKWECASVLFFLLPLKKPNLLPVMNHCIVGPVGATGYESGVSHHTCPWLDDLWSSSGLPGSEPRQLMPSEHKRDESLTSRMELFSRSVCGIRIPRTLVRRICISLSGNHIQLTKRTDEQLPRSTFSALSIGSATSRGMRGMP